jgi:hypothetical protein
VMVGFLRRFFWECCLGFLGALPWVFQIGGMASENIVKCCYLQSLYESFLCKQHPTLKNSRIQFLFFDVEFCLKILFFPVPKLKEF